MTKCWIVRVIQEEVKWTTERAVTAEQNLSEKQKRKAF